MKKILTVCLCLLLVATMATAAFAANGAAFDAKASAETLYRGDTVTLTVNVNCDEQATSYGLMLNFDESVFELVDGSCTVTGTLVSSFNNGFAFMFQNPTAYSGAVGTVTLKVKDDAAFGAATVTGDAAVKNGTEDVVATGCTVSLTVACKHTYGAWTEIDAGHEKICSVCGDVQTADHTWDEGVSVKDATCTEEGTTQYTCTACAATKEEAVAMLEHTYGAWESVDETSHKHACTVCQFEEAGDHAFAAELTSGEQTHWYACECGAKAEEAAHVFDETAWNKDAENHWHSCACGAKSGEAEHAWDDGKITTEATQKKEGVKTFTCKDCAETKTEKIAKLPKPQNKPEENPKTGDAMMIVPFAVIALGAVFMFACVATKKKIGQ